MVIPHYDLGLLPMNKQGISDVRSNQTSSDSKFPVVEAYNQIKTFEPVIKAVAAAKDEEERTLRIK